MSKTTDFLKLFKYDLAQDGAQNFDIVKALNENWDKIEAVLAGTAAEDAAKALHNLIGAAAALEQAGLAKTDLVGVDDVSAGTGKKVTLQNLATYLAGIGGAAKIQTGSYVGTGTYGADNPCRLTFDSLPYLIIVRGGFSYSSVGGYKYSNLPSFLLPTLGTMYVTSEENTEFHVKAPSNYEISSQGMEVQWWGNPQDPSIQLNAQSETYRYTAFLFGQTGD